MTDQKANRTGYMCKIDFISELGEVPAEGIQIFASVEDCKKGRPCVKECGIVKVEVTLLEDIK